jgi:hypothetical protein
MVFREFLTDQSMQETHSSPEPPLPLVRQWERVWAWVPVEDLQAAAESAAVLEMLAALEAVVRAASAEEAEALVEASEAVARLETLRDLPVWPL